LNTTVLPVTNATKLGTVKLCAAAKTDVGRRRSENQDSYGFAHTASASLFIVADGMGGARGGGTASAMAVNIVMDGAISQDGKMSAEALKNAIVLANRVIFSRSQCESQLSGMGTTIVALAFVDDVTVVAHVGDSRIYSWHGGEIHQLTRDHTLVQELVDTGAIAPQDAANHPIAHMLTRSLGPAESTQPDVNILPQTAKPGDKFLLCSDGLYNHVSNEEIGEVLATRSPKEAVDVLVQMALDGGGSDNVTIQIVEVLNLADETVHITRPEDGAAEKFISSEINAQEFSGAALNDFTDALDARSAKPAAKDEEVVTPEEIPPIAETVVNGSANQSETRPTSLADELLVENQEEDTASYEGDEYAQASATVPHSSSAQKATPLQFAILVVAALSASFLALWLFVIPSSKPNASEPKKELLFNSSASSEMAAEVLTWNPEISSSSSETAVLASSSEASSEAPKVPETSSTPPVVSSSSTELLVEQPADDPASALALQEKLAAQSSSVGQLAAKSSVSSPENVEGLQSASERVSTPALGKYANILAWASDIRISNVPPLSLGGSPGKEPVPDEPIVWEKEKQLVQKIVESNQEQSSVAPALQTPDEMAELAQKKEQSRIRINDVDIKLELLLVENKDQAKKKQARLEMESSRLEEVKRALEEDLKASSGRLASWEELQKKMAQSDPLKIADEVANLSESVQAKRSEYTDATERYLKTVDEWQANPKDTELAAKMSSLGRAMKEQRVQLETAVSEAVTTGRKTAADQTDLLRFHLAGLKLREDEMNREIGLIRAYAASSVERRRETQRKLLEERRVQLETLNQLQKSLSDEAEVSFRQKNPQLFYSSL